MNQRSIFAPVLLAILVGAGIIFGIGAFNRAADKADTDRAYYDRLHAQNLTRSLVGQTALDTTKLPPAPPRLATVRTATEVTAPFGSATIKPGTRVPILSRDGQDAVIRYANYTTRIPLSALDLVAR